MDVDVVLDGDSLDDALRTVVQAAAEASGAIVHLNSYAGRRHVIVALPDSAATRPLLIEFDLQSHVVEGDLLLMEASQILSDTRQHGDVRVPASDVDAALLLLRSILRKKSFRESAWDTVRQAARDDSRGLRSALAGILGDEMSRRLLSAVSAGERDSLLALREEVIHQRLTAAPSAGFSEGRTLTFRVLRRIRWLLRPPGTFVCLVGPDGAGKTTVARHMVEALQQAPYSVRYIYGGKGGNAYSGAAGPIPSRGPGIIGWIRRRLRPRAGVLWTIWTTFAMLRLLPREVILYHREIRPVLSRNGIVVLDRYYFFDMLASVWHELPEGLRTSFLRLMPMPDLTILLANQPAVIRSRKAERSVDEIADTIGRLRAMGCCIPRWVEKTTDAPVGVIAWSGIRTFLPLRRYR